MPNLGEPSAEGVNVAIGEAIEKNFELFALVPLQKLQDRGLQELLTKYRNPEIGIRL